MRRTPGWTRLAGIALELAALAFLGYVVMAREGGEEPRFLGRPSIPQDDTGEAQDDTGEAQDDTGEAQDDTGEALGEAGVARAPSEVAGGVSEPMAFITESADDGARYYRALGDDVELIAGFYSDGRLRLADRMDRRFAGLLQGAHADLLELGGNSWSEVFLRTTPAGAMQLELRGGPYDARVLTCEPFDNLKDHGVI